MSVESATSSTFPPRLRRWLVRLAIAAGAIVALIVIAWLAAPPIIRGQLESRLTEALGRKTTVDAVEFNPLHLRLTVRKLAIANADGVPPLLAVDEIVADVSSASLWHRAPVLDALKVVGPAVSLARDRDGRYSIDDLVDKARNAPEGPTPGFSLNNIEVDGGSIAFDDGVTGRGHRVDNLAIGIPFLSSLPYQTDIRVTPRLEGAFNGSHFALGGTTAPFAQRREAALDIDLDALPIKDYLAYLPARPRVTVGGGKLTTRLQVVFVDGEPGARKLEVRGDARIDGFAVARRGGSPLLTAQSMAVTLDRIDVFGRDVRIAKVEIETPSLDVQRLADGTLELAQPLLEGTSDAKPPTPAAKDQAWSIAVAKAAVSRGALSLVDETSAFRSSLADVSMEATNLTNKAGEKAQVSLSFVSADRIAAFKGQAEVEPLVPAMSGTFDLTKFSLGLLFPYYKDVLAVDVQQGSIDLSGRFALEADGNVKISQGTASIAGLALAYPGNRQPFWRFPTIVATGTDVDVRERNVTIGEMVSRNAALRLARERDGSIDVARVLKTAPTTGTAKDERTWTLTLAKLAMDGATVDVEDRVHDPAVKVAIRDLSLSAANYSNARGAKSTVALKARAGNRGRIAWKGLLGTNPVSASGHVDVTGLDLVTMRPYVESQVNVSLTAGALAAKGTVALDVLADAPVKATWKGDVAVTDFAALDKPTASDLLRWNRLALEGLDVTLEPLRMTVGRIAAEDYFARLIIYQDGTLNLTRLLTPGQAPAPPANAKPARAPSDAPPREALPIAIGRIEVARGNVNFSDFFVRPNYSVNLTDVTGSVGTMSADQAGDIAIAARVDRTAPVEVSGRVSPFARELSLDIAAKARDVDLPPLTPYAVKYAGYGIEKGKLTFDVHYRVENRRLTAENKLVLDQLTFNPQRIDSETATKLPVLLAVSLLKDTRGVIDIELPIAGSLDDPEFSVGGLIIRVIVNLITKAVTAPFALLSAAFGRGEELSVVPFAPGSAALDAEATKRVDTLGKALADRPALKLDIGGRADPAGDREAMRRASLELAMKREKMKSLAGEGSAPASADLVTIGAEERARWLSAAYRESSIKDRPRNVIGMLKEIPPAEMEAMLLAEAKVDDDALRLLANARAQGVKEALAAKNVAGDRLFLTAPRLSGESASAQTIAGLPSRVDLALR